ncbi:hypothetical protein NBRC116600_21550 [Thalassotalea sp. SU-HH00458]
MKNSEISSLNGANTTANKLKGIEVTLIQGTATKFAGNANIDN